MCGSPEESSSSTLHQIRSGEISATNTGASDATAAPATCLTGKHQPAVPGPLPRLARTAHRRKDDDGNDGEPHYDRAEHKISFSVVELEHHSHGLGAAAAASSFLPVRRLR